MKPSEKFKQINNTVIAFGTPDKIKTAALNSEYVLPICFSEYPNELLPPFMDERDGAAAPIILHLLFIDGVLQQLIELGCKELIKYESDIISITWHGDRIESYYKPVNGKEEELEKLLLKNMKLNPMVSPVVWTMAYESACLDSSDKVRFLSDLGKHNFTSSKARYFGVECQVDEHNPDGEEVILLSIKNIPLANPGSVEWDQIIRFRNDKNAIKQFRNLKELFLMPFKKKNRQYIENTINKRLDNYCGACIEYGINTQASILNLYINPQFFSETCLPDLLALAENKSFAGQISHDMEGVVSRDSQTPDDFRVDETRINLAGLGITIKTVKIDKDYLTNNKELNSLIGTLPE